MMTTKFLLVKLKTLVRSPDDVAWKGVEDDLRAFERTVIKRCAAVAREHSDSIADKILATLPGRKAKQ